MLTIRQPGDEINPMGGMNRLLLHTKGGPRCTAHRVSWRAWRMSQVPRASATHRGGAEKARTRAAGDRVHGHALIWEIKTQTLKPLSFENVTEVMKAIGVGDLSLAFGTSTTTPSEMVQIANQEKSTSPRQPKQHWKPETARAAPAPLRKQRRGRATAYRKCAQSADDGMVGQEATRAAGVKPLGVACAELAQWGRPWCSNRTLLGCGERKAAPHKK
jgi:hypothetical protein